MIPYEELVLEILKNTSNIDIDILKNIKRTFAREHNMDTLPSNIQILRAYRSLLSKGEIKSDLNFEKLIKKRSIRSESGIVAVQVLTKPFRCPGQCIFCPNDPTMPKSYIKTEPGAMRALLNHFDPIAQVYNRLISLSLT
jgi:elongator complex protein 3